MKAGKVLGPSEIIAGGEGEVTLDDAEVDPEAGAELAGPGGHPVALAGEEKLLLIDGGGGKEGRLHARFEPVGRRGVEVADGGRGLALARDTLGDAVDEGDEDG